MKSVGVVGLGNMGRGMAMCLKRAGFAVVGTDTSGLARNRAAADGIDVVDGLQALAARAEIFILSLPTPEAVTQVVAGESGLLDCARAGALIIDTSTSHPRTTRALWQRLQAAGIALIDAPVSGGAKGAASGQLTMLLGGSEVDIARAEPALAALSARRIHIGDIGAGHGAKLANNLIVAIHLIAAAEITRLASHMSVSAERILEGINASSGRSAVTQVNFPNWILTGAFNSGFTMKLMRKDVALAADLIAQSGLSLPLAQKAASLWRQSAESIPDDEDFNRIVELESPKTDGDARDD